MSEYNRQLILQEVGAGKADSLLDWALRVQRVVDNILRPSTNFHYDSYTPSGATHPASEVMKGVMDVEGKGAAIKIKALELGSLGYQLKGGKLKPTLALPKVEGLLDELDTAIRAYPDFAVMLKTDAFNQGIAQQMREMQNVAKQALRGLHL